MNKTTLVLIFTAFFWMALMSVFMIMQATINDKLIKVNELQSESIRLLNDKLNRLQCMPQPVMTERHALILLN